MPRYIDADALLKAMDTWDKFGFSHSGAFVREPENDDYVPYVQYDDMVKCVEGMPTADVVPKEDMINELVKEISDRIIQALEANYEIIPKKPVVRCKDCEYGHMIRDVNGLYFRVCGSFFGHGHVTEDNDFCKWGERRMKNE